MATYKTPDVYVEEISTLPPSVAGVSSAIPAFIGYTEKGTSFEPTKISTFMEYKETFGGPESTTFTVATADDVINSVTPSALTNYMYYQIDMYFKNGGSPCYVISTGAYKTPARADYESALAALEKKDEPTLIVFADAVNLATAADYYSLCQQALTQCNKLKDRFAIFDVLNASDAVAGFRTGVGTNYLKYGAAYYPYIQTALNYEYDEANVTVTGLGVSQGEYLTSTNGVVITYAGDITVDNPTVTVALIVADGVENINFVLTANSFTIQLPDNAGVATAAGATPTQVRDAWTTWKGSNDEGNFDLDRAGTYADRVDTAVASASFSAVAGGSSALSEIKSTRTALYSAIQTEIAKERVVLPPSVMVAGVYCATDRDRGVWKAPANVSLSSVIGPVTKITNEEQESLNVDADAGKSINAIRSFHGKGTLVWGARTLAGNDNEWRYVSVRRLFIMIEEATKKSTAFAVFEPNDAATWLKVQAMIESYLYGLWQQGALAGGSSQAAYYVNVGLDKTMTQQDILEGNLIVEIGIAAVRPAEFIVLRFSHKLQEA